MASITLRRLSEAVKAAGIESPAQLESLALKLSPHQSRLFSLLLEQGECDTITVRQRASIGNISECAKSLNQKLDLAGDGRRVVCDTRGHENKFGERGVLGWWRLVDAKSEAA